MPTALALSPHLDDATFSAGGTLARLAGEGWHIVMATVFTASVPDPQGFALACQSDKGLPAEVDYMALRRDEDRAAARALGLGAPVHLPFREAPHRGYESAPALFAPPHPDDDIAKALRGDLARLVAEADLVLAPQAIGAHVDHVQLVRALRGLLHEPRPSPPVLWWRDFPYTVRTVAPKEPLHDRFAPLPEVAITFDASCAARKERACAAYVSQVGFQFGGSEGLARRLADEGRIERFRAEGTPPPGLASPA